jgi:hypothetical protein
VYALNDWLAGGSRSHIGNALQYNLPAAMSNSTLKKHLLVVSVFVALWILWMIGLIPDSTAVLY